MVSDLGKLQRKIRFQQWKYVIAIVLMSLASAAVAFANLGTTSPERLLLSENSAKENSATPIPSATESSTNFLDVLATLDNYRQQAFEKRDLQILALVNLKGSKQARADEAALKRIIRENLSFTFADSTLVSALQIPRFSKDSSQALLEVKDIVQGKERIWYITLTKNLEGAWRYSEVSRVLP